MLYKWLCCSSSERTFLNDHLQVNEAESAGKATNHLSNHWHGGLSLQRKARWWQPQAQTQLTVVTLEMDGKAHLTKITAPRESSFSVNELNFSNRTISGMLTHCSTINLSVTLSNVDNEINLRQKRQAGVGSWCKGSVLPKSISMKGFIILGKRKQDQGEKETGEW